MKWFNRIYRIRYCICYSGVYTVLQTIYVTRSYTVLHTVYVIKLHIQYTVYVILLFQDKTLSYSSLQPKHFQRSNKTDSRIICQLKTYNLMENVTMENVTI